LSWLLVSMGALMMVVVASIEDRQY